MDYYEIGQRIRKLRKAHGLSQESLAEKIGISTTHMSHIETGNTKLSLPVLVDLAGVFNVQVDDLLSDRQPPLKSTIMNEMLQILDSCTPQQLKIVEDMIRALVISLNKNM